MQLRSFARSVLRPRCSGPQGSIATFRIRRGSCKRRRRTTSAADGRPERVCSREARGKHLRSSRSRPPPRQRSSRAADRQTSCSWGTDGSGPRSAADQPSEGEGVADRVVVSIVVEVDEDVLAGSVPSAEPIGPTTPGLRSNRNPRTGGLGRGRAGGRTRMAPSPEAHEGGVLHS
jgi:hypothetical protein